MSTLSKLSAQPVKRIIAGKEWTFTPLTPLTWGEVETYLADEIINRAHRVLEHTHLERVNPTLAAISLKSAYETADKISVWLGSSELTTMKGLTYTMYVSLKQHHKDITLDEVRAIFEALGSMEFNELYQTMGGLPDATKEGAESKKNE